MLDSVKLLVGEIRKFPELYTIDTEDFSTPAQIDVTAKQAWNRVMKSLHGRLGSVTEALAWQYWRNIRKDYMRKNEYASHEWKEQLNFLDGCFPSCSRTIQNEAITDKATHEDGWNPEIIHIDQKEEELTERDADPVEDMLSRIRGSACWNTSGSNEEAYEPDIPDQEENTDLSPTIRKRRRRDREEDEDYVPPAQGHQGSTSQKKRSRVSKAVEQRELSPPDVEPHLAPPSRDIPGAGGYYTLELLISEVEKYPEFYKLDIGPLVSYRDLPEEGREAWVAIMKVMVHQFPRVKLDSIWFAWKYLRAGFIERKRSMDDAEYHTGHWDDKLAFMDPYVDNWSDPIDSETEEGDLEMYTSRRPCYRTYGHRYLEMVAQEIRNYPDLWPLENMNFPIVMDSLRKNMWDSVMGIVHVKYPLVHRATAWKTWIALRQKYLKAAALWNGKKKDWNSHVCPKKWSNKLTFLNEFLVPPEIKTIQGEVTKEVDKLLTSIKSSKSWRQHTLTSTTDTSESPSQKETTSSEVSNSEEPTSTTSSSLNLDDSAFRRSLAVQAQKYSNLMKEDARNILSPELMNSKAYAEWKEVAIQMKKLYVGVSDTLMWNTWRNLESERFAYPLDGSAADLAKEIQRHVELTDVEFDEFLPIDDWSTAARIAWKEVVQVMIEKHPQVTADKLHQMLISSEVIDRGTSYEENSRARIQKKLKRMVQPHPNLKEVSLLHRCGHEALDTLVEQISSYQEVYSINADNLSSPQELKDEAKIAWDNIMVVLHEKHPTANETLAWKAWRNLRSKYVRNDAPQKWRGRLEFLLDTEEYPLEQHSSFSTDDSSEPANNSAYYQFPTVDDYLQQLEIIPIEDTPPERLRVEPLQDEAPDVAEVQAAADEEVHEELQEPQIPAVNNPKHEEFKRDLRERWDMVAAISQDKQIDFNRIRVRSMRLAMEYLEPIDVMYRYYPMILMCC
ncbi:hypothetical protein QR680_019345 [Steinernema hermaphroditum]|uniref:MADF domain-containing protein n=1 Tax=Steinernema hermaphroditum TaxID=289476 RepID=A0AA39GNW1_9BILA|nr:hypothetical protein QR680_019345 [Steinernema hermaphroditum]